MIGNSVIPYNDIDEEIVNLCKALNSIDGVETVSSCCGHGRDLCRIWFTVKDIITLSRLCFHCFNHEGFWTIQVDLGDPDRTWEDLHFCLESTQICDQSDFDKLTNRLEQRGNDIKYSNEEWRSFRTKGGAG